MDLPGWQALYAELGPQGFVPITVALDSAGADAAGPWIRAAKPTHPSLVDREHRVAALYDMLNVPIAVWIDEQGRIVRPPEPSSAFDGFRAMDRKTFALAPDVIAEYGRRRAVYHDAIRDWVRLGAESPYVVAPTEARDRLAAPSNDDARATASFRLGQWLHAHGRATEAAPFLEEAVRLRPESWCFFRQRLALGDPMAAGGPEFWGRVDALGERRYYAPVRMPGLDD